MTIFGTFVGSIPPSRGALIASYPHQYDRFAGDYPVERFEEAVALQSGSPYTLSVHRMYHEIEDSFLEDNEDNRVTRDGNAGRSIAVSSKVRGIGTWAQAGSATSGTMYNAIVARGIQVAAWLAAHPTCDIWWTLHHEPNNGDATNASLSGSTVEATGINNWHAGFLNIYNIWTGPACNVPVYVGAQDGTVISHGLIAAGPNIAGPGGTSNSTVWLNWYGTPDGSQGVQRSAFWNIVQMAPVDTYPGTSSGNALWRAFPEDFLGDGGSGSTTNGMHDFIPARITAQNNAGKILYPSIWELGFAEIDARNIADTVDTFSGTLSANWPVGLPATMANQFVRAADYFTNTGATHWGGFPFHSVIYWDSLVESGGRAPWMPDQKVATWQAFVDFISAIEGEVVVPPPSAFPGVGAILG